MSGFSAYVSRAERPKPGGSWHFTGPQKPPSVLTDAGKMRKGWACRPESLQLVDGDLGAIREQLAAARSRAAAHGDYSDTDWYHKALSAQRHKSRLSQQIQAEFGRRRARRREEGERSDATLLMTAVKEVLPEDWRQRVVDYFLRLKRRFNDEDGGNH